MTTTTSEFPPYSSRGSGRTTQAVATAIELARQGKAVAFVVAYASEIGRVWDMVACYEDFSSREASYLKPDHLRHISGGHIEFMVPKPYGYPGFDHVIYDHHAVGLELDRINRDIEALEKRKSWLIAAGYRGLS